MRFSLLEHPCTYNPAHTTEASGRWYTSDLYAARHSEMAELFPHKAYGHRLIACIESMPVIGWVAGIMEEIAINLFAEWVEGEKMRSNLEEALTQHIGPEIARAEEIKPTQSRSFRVHTSQAENQGKRRTMEDRIYTSHDAVGVFDGHLGSDVAEKLKSFNWSLYIDLPRVTLRRIFRDKQREVASVKAWENQGSTATVVMIDRSQGAATTATVGDSYAFLYRQIEGQYKAIPLSPIRNWKHPKELARARSFDDTFTPRPEVAKPRFNGLEASRSIGDAGANDDGRLFTSHMPKVTQVALQVNDIIVVASDGLWDTKKHSEIIAALNPESTDIAGDIMGTINLSARNQDNVAIVALKILAPF